MILEAEFWSEEGIRLSFCFLSTEGPIHDEILSHPVSTTVIRSPKRTDPAGGVERIDDGE